MTGSATIDPLIINSPQVNGHGGFGAWAADVSRYPSDIHEILPKHST